MQIIPDTGSIRTSSPLVGQAYTFSAPQFSNQTCINLYPTAGHLAQGAKYDSALFPTFGTTLLLNIPNATQQVRWLGSIAGVMYAVVGNGFYLVDSVTVSYTLKGTLNTSSGLVKHAYNNTQLLLVDGTNGYVYTPLTSTWSVITDSVFTASACPTTVAFQQGYAIYTIPGTNNFQVGKAKDFTTWPVTYEDQFQYSGDNLVTCVSTHLDVWMFGETRTEVRQNAPSAASPSSQPFKPIPNVLIEMGCAAQYSVALLSNGFYWLAKNEQGGYQVVTVTGQYSPLVVSTEPLHQEWSTYSTISDAQAYAYIYNGHPFYVLTFPTANKTWVYDAAQNLWHQWATQDGQGNQLRHVSNCFAFHKNVPYVGDYQTGNIYKLDPSNYTDNGTAIIRERTFPTTVDKLKRVGISQLWLDCEVGVGTDTGQGSNPRVMLQVSGDGGITFGPERLGTLGKIGDFHNHVRWYRMGTKRQFTPRIRISDPVYCAFFAAYIEAVESAS